MNKLLKKSIIVTLLVIFAGVFFISIDADARGAFTQRPILSILGDSVSSYRGYESDAYYGTDAGNCACVMDKRDMWWYTFAEKTGYEIGWPGGQSSSRVSLPSRDTYSLNNEMRINNLGNFGTPDMIVVYGGYNDGNRYFSVDKNTFKYNYNKLIDKLHNLYTGVKLVLVSPYHFNNDLGDNRLIDEYAAVIKREAEKNKDYYVDMRGNLVYPTEFHDPSHPNVSGMNKISDTIYDAVGDVGIDNISTVLDYDKCVVKIAAHSDNYDNLKFRFKLVNLSTGENIYNTGWKKNNCYYLDNVKNESIYIAYAEIDTNNDNVADDSYTKWLTKLTGKRQGTSIYNGVDYSAVYDFNYYVENNTDLYEAYRNEPYGALEHFVTQDMREGKQANKEFNAIGYKNRYVDLRGAFGNDMPAYYNHYINFGQAEGRDASYTDELTGRVSVLNGVDYSSVYDFDYYQKHFPDVRKMYGKDDVLTFLHFIMVGMTKGVQASENFNVSAYAQNNPDLLAAFAWNIAAYYTHYITYGQYEGRIAV